MKHHILASLCLIWSGVALAGSISDVQKSVEASMVVTGSIMVAPNGNVAGYTLHEQDKLPLVVVALIGKTIPGWKFKPVLVDGKPVLAKAKMNLRLVASPLGNGQYNLRVRGETFGNGSSSEWVSPKERKPPGYPVFALKAEAAGTTYLALEIGRDGHVQQAVAQQVNLRVTGSEFEMRMLRRAFAEASIKAAKDWTFNPPTAGPGASADHWTVRIPVDFNIEKRHYGEWDPYVPGPITPIPWEQDQVVGADNTDALPDGMAFAPDDRFVLLSTQGG